MDHKEFFEAFARLDFKTHVEGLTAFTAEELYQAIKARLIEELRAESVTGLGLHLIDTTGDANGR